MYELACPKCNAAAQYDFNDYLLMCPLCSATFRRDPETGHKELYEEHYIVPHSSSPSQTKDDILEWLARMHHRQGDISQEYKIKTLRGISLPFWIVAVEAHTVWKGMVKKDSQHAPDSYSANDWLTEQGSFRKNYRWAIVARNNICEIWGLARLHKPKEGIIAAWDGFPLDSTFTRGQIRESDIDKIAYDAREAFDTKFANGLPVASIQVSEDEALRRARLHIELYHIELARHHSQYLTDIRTELEIVGIQLVHLPFWFASYYYQPASALRHFLPPKEKHIIMTGFNNCILDGELAVVRRDKLSVNSIVCAAASIITFLLGSLWHSAFFLASLFFACIAIGSAYISYIRTTSPLNKFQTAH